jgi:hypothetical protein
MVVKPNVDFYTSRVSPLGAKFLIRYCYLDVTGLYIPAGQIIVLHHAKEITLFEVLENTYVRDDNNLIGVRPGSVICLGEEVPLVTAKAKYCRYPIKEEIEFYNNSNTV